jgi:glycosyltransferase involved in cell wall biosynthesis
MRVGWLADDPGYVGGAERTQAEFRSAAPKSVEVVSCPAGHVVPDLDRYVVNNCMSYDDSDLVAATPNIRYHHDVQGGADGWDRNIYCSPIQRERFWDRGATDDDPLIPPALDLERLRQIGQGQKLMGEERKGAVWLGMHPSHPGKGVDLAMDWARGNGGLDIYGNNGPLGTVRYEDVPSLLAGYKTFVHLPRALEPFGRSVVEAWACGCELVINKLVGARYWIEENPRGLQTASKDFWRVVCS